MVLDILCKVVDNYGDIGVVFRLARALAEIEPDVRLRIMVDDLEAFHKLEPAVDPAAAVQSVRGWTIVSWAGPDGKTAAGYAAAFEGNPPAIIIECFACGRPDWFEAMLFDRAVSTPRTIVNLEYLSAEPYADEFHRMPSLTRSPLVRKYLFMPGFTTLTGGLVLDQAFMSERDRNAHGKTSGYRRSLVAGLGMADAAAALEDCFWILVFGYERDYARIVDDIKAFNRVRRVAVFVAEGKSEHCFMHAWEKAGQPFTALRLPFVPQETWDGLLVACDFLIVRGEDSMARAAISGKGFLWHAYPQAQAHHLVKVGALLERMRPCFTPADFEPVAAAFLAFNGVNAAGLEDDVRVLPLLKARAASLARGRHDGFYRFAEKLIGNGNLAANLMTFLREIV